MTIAAMMYCDCEKDEHESDMVMPGFRFHPTEQELIDFYLRRKVEGKRFNIELIAFVDLYHYDPWELPALAAIGEKEWFFYVPRDRKYRIGNRPNRVTTSGYWKATGADKMILSDNMKPIGLKKTLVFYAGKAPRGIRTNWIMNEYRLPEHDTSQLLKAEISICKVYRRGGSGWNPEVIQSDQKQYRKHPSSSRMTPVEHNSRANHEMKAMDRAAGNYGTAMAAMSTVSELGEGDDGVSAFICQLDALLPTAEQFSPCSLALVLPEEHMAPFTVMPRSLGAVSSMRLDWNPH